MHDELQKIDMIESEFKQEYKQLQQLFQTLIDNLATNAPVQVIPIDLTRGRALPALAQLHNNLIEIMGSGTATATNWALEIQI